MQHKKNNFQRYFLPPILFSLGLSFLFVGLGLGFEIGAEIGAIIGVILSLIPCGALLIKGLEVGVES